MEPRAHRHPWTPHSDHLERRADDRLRNGSPDDGLHRPAKPRRKVGGKVSQYSHHRGELTGRGGRLAPSCEKWRDWPFRHSRAPFGDSSAVLDRIPRGYSALIGPLLPAFLNPPHAPSWQHESPVHPGERREAALLD